MSHAKLFLLVLDYNAVTKALGKQEFDLIIASLKGQDILSKMRQVLEAAKKLKPKQVPIFKAKIAIYFQLIFLLKERIQEEGLPALQLTAPQLAMDILEKADDKMKMVIDLDNIGKGYWNLLVDLLKEADFRSDDKIVYELVLTDGMVRHYASGIHLSGGEKGQAGQSALTDAMLSRVGRNIVKRLGLLLRTMKMYQSADHPSVEMGVTAMHGLLGEVLEGRKSITLTRLGSDLLIEDVKNRKKEMYVDQFVQGMDERNINSITITQGVSEQEIRAMAMLFARTFAQVKKDGGAKRFLDKHGVTHILVDQFKYGIISSDQVEEDVENVAQDEKMIENIVFTELVGRLKDGKSLGDLKTEDVGAAFKQLISGAFRKDKNAKKTLAQMMLALDPNLAEQALFSKKGIRDDIQWSSASQMVDQLLVEMPKGEPEERIRTLENLLKMTDLAIAKNKDTTLALIIEKITHRLFLRENDIDVVRKIVDVLVDITKSLIINEKFVRALDILQNMNSLKSRCEHLPQKKREQLTYLLPEIIEEGIQKVAEDEVVEVLVRDLDSDSIDMVDRVVKILELLKTESVVKKLLDGFLNDSRSVRNRCFQTLSTIGEKTLSVCSWKLQSLDDPKEFPRSLAGVLDEGPYYIARNAISLLAKLGDKKEKQMLKDMADDPDPRIRREIIQTLARIDKEEAEFLAKMSLNDQDDLVVRAAINTLGNLKSIEAEKNLIDLFFARPELRLPIIEALASIGGDEAEEILIGSTFLRFGGNSGRIYRTDNELRMAALKALGQCGKKRGQASLRRLIRSLKNPFLRILIFPMRTIGSRKEVLKIAENSLSRVNFRLKSNT